MSERARVTGSEPTAPKQYAAHELITGLFNMATILRDEVHKLDPHPYGHHNHHYCLWVTDFERILTEQRVQPDYRGVIRHLLGGEVPQGDKWYDTDNDGCASGKGVPITDAEMAALTDADATSES